jgi:hypothetical protein
MIQDLELYLTPKGGTIFTASGYGSRPVDLEAAGYNPMIGEGLEAYYQVLTANVDNCTSLQFDVVADDDGAGTNEVVLATTGAVVLASLTTALGVRRIGTLNRTASLAATSRYLGLKVTLVGSAPTQGNIAAWLQTGTGAAPANQANTL